MSAQQTTGARQANTVLGRIYQLLATLMSPYCASYAGFMYKHDLCSSLLIGAFWRPMCLGYINVVNFYVCSPLYITFYWLVAMLLTTVR